MIQGSVILNLLYNQLRGDFMKKTLSLVLVIILSLALLSACAPSSTDTGTQTQGGETGINTAKTEKGELYEQINGGDYLMGDPSKRDIFQVRHSPYKLIYTYDELVEAAENANNIESTLTPSTSRYSVPRK